jgi:hypothetical protein
VGGDKGGVVTAAPPTRKERRCQCCGHRWSMREPTRNWHTWCPNGAAWWRQITEWVTAVEEQRACFEVAGNLIGAGAVEYRRKCFEVASSLVGAPTPSAVA